MEELVKVILAIARVDSEELDVKQVWLRVSIYSPHNLNVFSFLHVNYYYHSFLVFMYNN